jgi:hypothetical protein
METTMNCLPGHNNLSRHLGELDQMCNGGVFLTDSDPEELAAEEDVREWEALGWAVDTTRS